MITTHQHPNDILNYYIAFVILIYLEERETPPPSHNHLFEYFFSLFVLDFFFQFHEKKANTLNKSLALRSLICRKRIK